MSYRFLSVGFLTAATFGCASATRGSSDHSLRVMSYNIEYGDKGLDKVINVIRDQHPDVVGLQEVDVHWSSRSRFEDQAALLAKGTGMEYRFARIYQIPNADPSKPPREFGVALLSRYPIVSFVNREITRHSTQDTAAVPAPMPGLLDTKINVNGRTFRVLNVHLDYRSDPTVRTQQAKEIMSFIGFDTIPIILTGDMNAIPDAPELHTLLTNMVDVLGDRGINDFTFSATKPEKRIDYIIISDNVCDTSARVVKVVASDHFPVMAEISPDKLCTHFRGGIR
jgi:endonuclease/exonuclease/phosphatase family metal-dependent hydrolase